MAGTVIEVNTSTLRSDISTIEGEINSLKSDVKSLRTTANQLSSMWDGNAKNAFIAAVNDDIRRLEDLIGAIGKFTDKTDTSRVEYEKCENAVAGIISAIRV